VSDPTPDVLALIPARGGSKSIPRKNVAPLAGHPLLAWSIAAAQEALRVTSIVVSTDDEEIREAALAYGALVPFRRPAELAQDDTPDLPVFLHALSWLAREWGFNPEMVVQLRPTSPLRPRGCVDDALALLEAHPAADSVRAVTAPTQNPYKMWRIEGQYLRPLLDEGIVEAYNMPRQRLPHTYWQTGHVDVARRATLLNGSMTGRRILPYVLDPRYALDIDTPEQWKFAEWVLEGGDPPAVRPTGTAPRILETVRPQATWQEPGSDRG
jgi:N-acylneuraminate cytidylyltransferase